MKLQAIIFLAGVFLTHSARGKPQGSQPLVARGSNVYGAGGSFNPGPFPAPPQEQPSPGFRQQQRVEQPQPLPRQPQRPVVAAPVPPPAPLLPLRPVLDDGISDALQPPAGQPTPLEEIDLRITDLTTGGRSPPVGSGGGGDVPTAALRPQRPQVVGSAGQAPPRLPSLDSVFGGVPPPLESPNGGEIGVGVLNRDAETVVGFERNSAQAGGEEEALPEAEAPGRDFGSQQQQQEPQQPPLVARGGDTYGAGQTREVPRPQPSRPPVSGDLDIRPEEPRTKEEVLSQAALPDDEPPSQPTAGVRALPPPPPPPAQRDEGQHHMGGIEWLPESIPGQPLIDYPVLVRIPDSGFDCANQEYDGFFADTSEEARCQAFWVCHNKQQDGFLCPNGTIFNQRYFTCDWWFNVRCEESPDYYELNKNIGVVGTRIDTLPAGVVAAESKVHPVFTLLSEMLHYPRVPPVPPPGLLKKQSSSPPRTPPRPAEDLQTSVKIMENVQSRQASRMQPSRRYDPKLTRSNFPMSVGMLPQFSMKSHKRAVSEGSAVSLGRGGRSSRHQRHHKRSRRHKTRAAQDPPPSMQNQNMSPQQNPGQGQNSQSATPEPYIETIQKIDLPMTASGTPKLMDDVTIMEKEGNITLSQTEKQIPLNLAPMPMGYGGVAGGQAGSDASRQSAQPAAPPPPPQPPPAAANQQAQGQYPSQSQYAPPGQAPQQQSPFQQGQAGAPGAYPPSGAAPASPGQTWPGQAAAPQQQSWPPPGQGSDSSPAQGAAQPQGQNQAAPNEGIVIDEDVKVEEGGSSPPVEKKLHFPPDPSMAQSGNQNKGPPSSGANSNNGTDGSGVSIDEDIKVDEGDSAHPVEEELRYPPGGKPTLVEGPANGASSHSGSRSPPDGSPDPAALHHDMPSELATPDDMANTKAPPSNGKTQVGEKIQITSETVSKVVQNPKPEPIRDPSGLQPPKDDKIPSMPQKKTSDKKRESKRSKKRRTKDFPRDLGDASVNSGKHYPEVRIIGNMQPVSKPSLASEVSRTVNAVDETLSLQPRASEQSRTFDAGTFYLTPRSKDSFHQGSSQNMPKNPIGVNLKIFVDQKPITAPPQSAPGYPAAGYPVAGYPPASYPAAAQAAWPPKNRRMIEPEEPESMAEAAYDYDISELPSWMQKAVAVKRSIESSQSSAASDSHELLNQEAAAEVSGDVGPMEDAPRPARKAVHVPDHPSSDVKRALAEPRVQKIFQSAREELMKLLGGPQETLDSEIDTLLGKAQSDKDKRENDMKLRLDSSSLTSYPELGLDPF